MVQDFSKPMQLLKSEDDRFRGFALYVREGCLTYRQRSYKCEYCEVIVVKRFISSHTFFVFGVYRNPDLSDNILIVC